MRSAVGVAAIVSCLLLGPSAFPAGASPEHPPGDTPCAGGQRALTQIELDGCAHQRFIRADRELQTHYSLLVAKLDVERRRELSNAESAWVTFRDATCALENFFSEGGSIHPMELSFCGAQMTEQRTRELQAMGKGVHAGERGFCDTARTQEERARCARERSTTADRELNTDYGRLLASSTDAAWKSKLRTAEAAWISFRDATCHFEATGTGLASPFVREGCLTKLTEARTAYIREALRCVAAISVFDPWVKGCPP